MDIRTVINAENPGRIIATSSVKTVRTIERSGDTSLRTRSSGLEYEFNLSSSEGALLILPEGAERHDLRNHHRFLEAATQHGADWYRFAEEKVGQIIGNDSLYLITGLYKTRSWSLAAFEKTAGSEEYPAQFRLSQVGGDNIAATCTWDTSRALDWRVGPIDNYGFPNQAVFIRGFKVAHRTGMFGTRWISVKADAPSTRPNPVESSGTVPGDSWPAYIFGGLSTGRTTESSRSGTRDEIDANPALDAARNEILNNGALAVGEHVVIQRIPEASQAFHPSDIINKYLLNKEPSANIAITHDNEWISLLEENLLRPEDFVQEGLLETLVSQNYHITSEAGAVYLRSRNNDSGTFNANMVDATIEGRELGTITVVDAIPSTERGDITAPLAPHDQDTSQVNPMWTNLNRIVESSSSISSNSLEPQDDKVVPDGKSEEEIEFSIPSLRNESPSLQIPDSSHRKTPPEQGMTGPGVHDRHGPTLSMSQTSESLPQSNVILPNSTNSTSSTITANSPTSVSGHDGVPNHDHEQRLPIDLTSQITREGRDPVAFGGFADIYRGMLQSNANSTRVAIKAIRTYSGEDDDFTKKEKPTSLLLQRLRREVRVWLSLEHDNLLPLLGTTMGFSRFPAMVCPWAENGALTSYLKNRHADLSAVEILGLLDNVASGLQYLHSHSVVHGDLSGSNILISKNGSAWITDFGLSTLLTELGGTTFATSFHARDTIRWVAPELLEGCMSGSEFEEGSASILPTTQNDVYSFGGLMLQILSGNVPYHYYTREIHVITAVMRGITPKRPSNALVTERRWTFIQRCWSTVDITRSRPTSDEIVAFTKNELACVRAP